MFRDPATVLFAAVEEAKGGEIFTESAGQLEDAATQICQKAQLLSRKQILQSYYCTVFGAAWLEETES